MSLDKIVVTIVGTGIIGLIYWFFFGKRSTPAEASVSHGEVDVVVDGGYKPSVIKVERGKDIKLSILRKDPNSCLEEIVLPDFKIKKYLPLNKKVEINIKATKAGTYLFHCGMNMYHGKVIVE